MSASALRSQKADRPLSASSGQKQTASLAANPAAQTIVVAPPTRTLTRWTGSTAWGGKRPIAGSRPCSTIRFASALGGAPASKCWHSWREVSRAEPIEHAGS